MPASCKHHYTPVWYQKRFLSPDSHKFHYLDLTPEVIHHSHGKYQRNERRVLGPKSCFFTEDLYSITSDLLPTDYIESHFFGLVDQLGSGAVGFYSDYDPRRLPRMAFSHLLAYIDAQKLRTPKGIDFIRAVTKGSQQNAVMTYLQNMWQSLCTIWSESIIVIADASDSQFDFILSDHPVTTYNRRCFPKSKYCRYPFDAPIEMLGTHTIFPLDKSHCAIFTNLGYIRSPSSNPITRRENPRYFEQAYHDIRSIQHGMKLSDNNVLSINYILKNRAKKFIASEREELLHPEDFLATTQWDQLGDEWFLFPDPRKVSFSTGLLIGYKDGSSSGQDEYGRPYGTTNPRLEALRKHEMNTHHEFCEIWDKLYGPLTPEEYRKL